VSNKVHYILTSTQKWGKAFSYANYQVIIPEELNIKSITYLMDSMQLSDNKDIYFLHRDDFMPDKDFILYFENLYDN